MKAHATTTDPRQESMFAVSPPPASVGPAGAPVRPAARRTRAAHRADLPFLTLPSLRARRIAHSRAERPLVPAVPADPDAVDSMAAQGGTSPIPPRIGEGDHAQHGGGARADDPDRAASHSPALADILALRARHREELGHTPAADDARDLFDFSKGAGRHLRDMNEAASLHRIERTQTYAIKLAAYALAIAESCTRRLAALPPRNEVLLDG